MRTVVTYMMDRWGPGHSLPPLWILTNAHDDRFKETERDRVESGPARKQLLLGVGRDLAGVRGGGSAALVSSGK